MILKSMQYVAFHGDSGQITHTQQSNANTILRKMIFQHQIYQVLWSSMEFLRGK